MLVGLWWVLACCLAVVCVVCWFACSALLGGLVVAFVSCDGWLF